MSLPQKRRETSARLPAVRVGALSSSAERCLCVPFSPLCQPSLSSEQTGIVPTEEQFVPASEALQTRLRTLLQDLRLTTSLVSVCLIHIAQLEVSSVSSALQEPSFRRNYEHVTPGQREQIVTNVRRVIRLNDQLCLEDEAGGAFVFPEVDPYGISSIVERVYQSICLLQAQTILPPLARETTILLGCGSLSTTDTSFEQLFFSLSQPARHITLRSALLHQFVHSPVSSLLSDGIYTVNSDLTVSAPPAVPFLDLPRDLPYRLKQLIPYSLASDLRCAPVGRDQYRLTVAMADPHNPVHIQRLAATTRMTIYPVACELEDLDMLLATKW